MYASQSLAAAVLFAVLASQFQGTCMSQSERPEILDAIQAELRSDDPDRIFIAIGLLAKSERCSQEVIRLVTPILDDDRWPSEQTFERGLSLRQLAVNALRDVDAASLPVLVERLPTIQSSKGLVAALGIISSALGPSDDAFRAIKPLTRHDDENVRAMAICTLSAISTRQKSLAPVVAAGLEDTSSHVRWAAVTCLRDRPQMATEQVAKLSELLEDDSQVFVAISDHFMVPRSLRADVARALGVAGPAARGSLIKLNDLARNSRDVNVRVWSAMAICRIDDQPPNDALSILGNLLLSDLDDEWTENEAIYAIIELGEMATFLRAQLQQALRHKSAEVRGEVPRLLLMLHGHNAVADVSKLAWDSDLSVALRAVEALDDHTAHGEEVVAAYVHVLSRPDDLGIFHREAAIDALRRLGPRARSAIPTLELLLKEDPAVLTPELAHRVHDAIGSIRQPNEE